MLISCKGCDVKTKDEINLKMHEVKEHVIIGLAWSFCDFAVKDETDLGTHGDSAIITIVGNQQILLNDAMQAFQENMENILNSVVQGQNVLKSEIMLLREEVAILKEEKKEHSKEMKKAEEKKENERRENERKEKEKNEKEKKQKRKKK